MTKIKLLFVLLLLSVLINCDSKEEFIIENEFLSREIKIVDNKLYTSSIYNKIFDKELLPKNTDEFKIRISKGTDKEGTDVELTSNAFSFVKVIKDGTNAKAFLLENKQYKIEVEIYYDLEKDDFYTHKCLKIRAKEGITLERIDVEFLEVKDAFQPYKLKQITAQSLNKITTKSGYAPEREENTTDFKSGLGQPLFTIESATFFGIEFPAASNFVKNNTLNCGYLWGKELKVGETYQTYKAVVGVADDYQFIDEVFYDYINDIKIRPLRLQVQYNSWFDFYQDVTKEKFEKSVKKVYQELITERGIKPINTYVIDDGWQDSFSKEADWSDTLWKINTDRFAPDFKSSHELVKAQNGTLGLWYSPGCFFGANKMVKKLGEQGFESLDFSMSMAGPKYMNAFEARTLELANQGISYFKFDGIFGHLYTRAF